MDYYLDVKILPDAEFGQNHFMNVLGSRLHLFLVANKELNIGMSFPGYSLVPKTLGDVLRLHGSLMDLEQLAGSQCLKGMSDYVEYGDVADCPATDKYVDVRRVQAKSSPHRLARRYAKRHGVSFAEALEKYKKLSSERLKYPFFSLNSQSTGQHFYLFIRQSAPHSNETSGGFNSFGLSKTASLPWF